MKKAILAVTASAVLYLSCGSSPALPSAPAWNAEDYDPAGESAAVSLHAADNAKCIVHGYTSRAEDGTTVLNLERLSWFSSWHNGWTEAEIILSGVVSLEENNGHLSVRPVSPVQAEYAESAAIRYRDLRLSGREGTDTFNRRLSRISAAVAYLREELNHEDFPVYMARSRKERNRAFYLRAGAVLFPEVYGYPEGTAESADVKENRSRGEGIVWDTVYTVEQMPEQLHDVRNTGTLYRDWEETAELFYYVYVLENEHDE